jgi:hypothetical protein
MQTELFSKNKLHLHLHAECQKQPKIQNLSHWRIHQHSSNSQQKKDIKGYGFRGWRYATALTQLTSEEKNELICLNTECIMSLVNREFWWSKRSKLS